MMYEPCLREPQAQVHQRLRNLNPENRGEPQAPVFENLRHRTTVFKKTSMLIKIKFKVIKAMAYVID